MQLRAADRVTIAVVFDKTESVVKPSDGRFEILICDVRKNYVGGNGAIFHRRLPWARIVTDLRHE